MKMILILVALLAGGFWGFGKFKDAFSGQATKEAIAKSQSQIASTRPQVTPVPAGSFASSMGLSLQPDTGKPVLPRSVKRIVFKYRDLPPSDTLQQVQSLGVVVIADPSSRSVTFSGPLDLVLDVANAFQASDVVPGSCGLQTYAVFVSKKAARGIDIAAAISSASSGSLFQGDIGGGSATLDIKLGDLSAVLELLADGESVEVVQRPHVRLLDRMPALVEAIDEIPIPTTAVSQGISQTSIEFRKVGLQLRINPVFLDGGRVRLDVSQQNGVIGQTVQIDGNDIPVVQTQTVSSSVELAIGQTIVYGGVRSYRHGTRKGLLGERQTVEEGALYVILSTYTDAPRARLPAPDVEYPASDWLPSPGLPLAPDAGEWIAGELLPPRGLLRLPPSK